jgi:signal transduction histidine kinase
LRSRTWPVLALGFGSLVVLIGLLGFTALRHGHRIYNEIQTIYETHRQSEKTLYDIRAGISVGGICVRDYLLDPSHLTAPMYGQQFSEARDSAMRSLAELEKRSGPEDADVRKRLRAEVDAYWDLLAPVFDWTPQQKYLLAYAFLRRQVLPRRDAVLSIAREIRTLNDNNFNRQRARVAQQQREFDGALRRMMLISLALGILVAAVSMVRITRLELRTEEQQRLSEAAERQLRRLSQQLVQAQEDERRSMARELHDEVGQTLTALRMDLGNLPPSAGADADLFHTRLTETKQLAEQALRTVRDLAMGLRPSMLDDLGLGPALEWQAREFSRRTGVPVTVQADGILDELPESHRTCVYRVVQEALTNCARHASAKNIRVNLHGRPNWLALTVEDDGVGFNPQESRGKGIGLIGIRERVGELGGSVEFFSQPGKGTIVRAELPLQEASEA